MNGDQRTQQLHTRNVSVRIGEALEARVKDPLWFLARQWQSGEFTAENGGHPALISTSWRDDPLSSITVGTEIHAVNPDQPLEFAVERETVGGDAPAWRSAALKYEFTAETTGHRLSAEDYTGHNLDWYHFDYRGPKQTGVSEEQHRRLTPTQVHIPGAPHPRWWRLEEPDEYFDSPVDPEPNALSVLLPEFFYLDVNNWYVIPLPALAGSLREITRVVAVDSFDIVTELAPASGATDHDHWRVFQLDSAADASGEPPDSRLLLLPNIALDVLHNDDLEEVRFLRDEEANLVWACEHRYRLPDGTDVVDGGGDRTPVEGPAPASPSDTSDLPRFTLRSSPEPHWIPYLPRHSGDQGATDGEIYLRRARTAEGATSTNPQYRSRIVAETWRVYEEEIPRSGVRVRRNFRFARGSDGTAYHWVGRSKEIGQRTTHPGLRYDYLEDPSN